MTYNYLKENNLIIFEAIVGSQAYGTNTPESDIDKKFVYVVPQDHIFGFGYVQQIEVNKDHTGYEIKRFLDLIQSNNPTLLELLNTPEDCIVYKDPVFDLILEKKDEFITKICKNSFGGYARMQIKKATGLNKKQNWEKQKVTRKGVLDFCYAINQEKTIPLKHFFNKWGMKQRFCGAVNIPHAKDVYALFYDLDAQMEISKCIYKGLVKEGVESNEIRLSSIPKGKEPIINFSYNKDGYSTHCKDYREYQEWLNNRNEQRYVDFIVHGQSYDGKNLMHCKRLVMMAREIAEGKGINIRRKDAAELLKIRKGKIDLHELIDWVEEEIKIIDELFDKSDLPKSVDKKMVDDLLIEIRKKVYGRSRV